MSEYPPAYDCMIRHEVRAYGTPQQVSWCDVPGDAGGETNWGWSSSTIRRLGLKPRDLGIDQDDFAPGCLKQMTEDAARSLYLAHFWQPLPYAQIDCQEVASKLFDFAVNAGPIAAGRLAQRALCDLGVDVAIDGVLGPHTVDALNGSDSQQVLAALCDRQAAYYRALTAEHPQYEQFRAGWLARAAWNRPAAP